MKFVACRKVGVRLFPVGALAVVALVAGCVGNPGSFTLTANAPSEMRIKDASGDVSFTLDIGTPACQDGQDNDGDFYFDYPDDPDCASPLDANERLAGVQPYEPSTLPLQVATDGVITSDPTGLDVQPWEFCPVGGDSPICFLQTAKGTGGAVTGSVGPSGLTLPWPTVIDIDASAGVTDLPADCHMGPIAATLTGSSYDEITGAATLTTPDVAVPAVTTCGVWNDVINAYLGLPTVGDASVQASILNAAGEPIAID